jgi:hypothetical protein
MTDATPAFWRAITAIHGAVMTPITVWIAFILVHLWLGLLNLYAPGLPLGDVTNVYRYWMDLGVGNHYWVGIDTAWVYPIVAIVPMLVSIAFGQALVASTWLTMIMLLNAIALGVLTGWGRSRTHIAIAWWWVAFLLLLGPIALGRIDSVTVPMAIVGVLVLASRPRAAAVILTIATWIKVWPAAILVSVVIAAKARVRVLVAAVATSAVIIAIALFLGSGANVFSFITEQTGRGLQIEAPISTFWLWQAFAGVPGTSVYYDREILTYQVQGNGVDAASSVMTPILAIVVLAIAVLGILAARNRAPVTEVLPSLVLALVTAFIAFNKVGSPQYITWLAVPVILGLATSAAGHGRSFRTPATLAIVLAVLTQLLYPYLYIWLVYVNPVMLIVLTARNLLLFVLLGWAVTSLWQVARPGSVHENLDEATDWLPAVWPLGSDREPITIDKE